MSLAFHSLFLILSRVTAGSLMLLPLSAAGAIYLDATTVAVVSGADVDFAVAVEVVAVLPLS